MTTDIERFKSECKNLLEGRAAAATLDPLEPELRVTLKASDSVGHIDAQIEITPDHLTQAHTMGFEIDQSYLPRIITECSMILEEYPVR